MYKNQLQELAQRSCFNLPSYACTREGPDHAPRFKATVTFNGETFESPNFCNTLRQAEHAAAEVALNNLSKKGPTQSLAAQILDETGVCKNLLQETAQKANVTLPFYTTVRSGPGHLPVFVSTVEIVGKSFTGESAKTKKQAEKNAAMAAWASLKQMAKSGSSSQLSESVSAYSGSSSQLLESGTNEEQEQMNIAHALTNAAKDAKCFKTQTTQSMQDNSTAQSQPKYVKPTNSKVKVTRFSESSAQAWSAVQAPRDSFTWISMDSKADPSSGQTPVSGHQHGNIWIKSGSSYHCITPQGQHLPAGLVTDASSFARELNTVNRIGSHGYDTLRPNPMPVDLLSIEPGIERHSALFTMETQQRDHEEWLPRDTGVIIRMENNDCNPIDSGLPLVQKSYSPMLWTHPNQWSKVEGQHSTQQVSALLRSATSLAPSVRVRQVVPVCSAPPHPSESEDDKVERPFHGATSLAPPVTVPQMVPVCSSPPRPSEESPNESNGEAATRQVLSQLTL